MGLSGKFLLGNKISLTGHHLVDLNPHSFSANFGFDGSLRWEMSQMVSRKLAEGSHLYLGLSNGESHFVVDTEAIPTGKAYAA